MLLYFCYIDFVASTIAVNFTTPINQSSVTTSSVFGWITVMQRTDLTTNWANTWAQYKNGFGDINTVQFWLGLERIHQLMTSANYRLRIELQQTTTGPWYSLEYWKFIVGDEPNTKYTLTVDGFVSILR